MTNAYSNRDFTGQDLSDRTDMDGLTIESSCLSNERPNAAILPPNLTGATFVDCNMDNVYIPPGNTLVRGSRVFFQVQEDGRDWILDPETLAPIEPM